MAFYGKFILDGIPFKLLNCSFEFHQGIDSNHNKPSAKPTGGLIDIIVEGQQGDEVILGWMLSPIMQKGGSIVFNRDDSVAPFKSIVFSNAYCIAYDEEFDHADTENLRISFRITAKKVIIDGQTHKNSW